LLELKIKTKKLIGVGYLNNEVWSGELTWAAIIMCRRIGQDYVKAGQADFGHKMLDDAISMFDAITKNVVPDSDGVWSSGGLIQVDGSCVHVNKRFLIPWRWFANPIGSSAATSWMTFHEMGFNPFVLGGGADSTFFQKSMQN